LENCSPSDKKFAASTGEMHIAIEVAWMKHYHLRLKDIHKLSWLNHPTQVVGSIANAKDGENTWVNCASPWHRGGRRLGHQLFVIARGGNFLSHVAQ
jgi:hypothetical protein